MSSYLIVYNICEIGKSNPNWYVKCISNLLKINYKKFHIVISGCRITPATKSLLYKNFGKTKQVSFYYTDHFIAVNVTFNQAVNHAVKHYGEFDGYIYVDSGIDIENNTNILNEINERFITNKYGMISVQPDDDHGHYWFMDPEQYRQDPYIRNQDYIIPLGRCVHLHFQCFHNDLYKAFGRLLPDIFIAYCTESVLSFLNASINKQWVILKDIILKHDKGIDGATLSHDHTGPRGQHWNNLYGAMDMTEILNDPKATEYGFGYEEIRGVLNHNPDLYTPEGYAKRPELRTFLRDKLYLQPDRLDYNSILDEFITV
jgi:hypothetical protein